MPATKIMLIRHAEKPRDDGSVRGVAADGRQDPEELVVRGWQRSGALAVRAARRKIRRSAFGATEDYFCFGGRQTQQQPPAETYRSRTGDRAKAFA